MHAANPSFQEQQNSYLTWVNSHLRKAGILQAITSLRDESVRNGTVLAALINIVSNKEIGGINARPQSEKESLNNVNQILHQLHLWNVKMYSVDPAAIVKGDVKSIMRVILAIAAHFKPMSVRQSQPIKMDESYKCRIDPGERDTTVADAKTSKLNTYSSEQISKLYFRTPAGPDHRLNSNLPSDKSVYKSHPNIIDNDEGMSQHQSITQIMQGVAVGIARTKQEILMSPSVENRSKFTFDGLRIDRPQSNHHSCKSNLSYQPQEDIITAASSTTTTMTLTNRPTEVKERIFCSPGHAVPCGSKYEKLRDSPCEMDQGSSDVPNESHYNKFISTRKVHIRKGAMKTRSFSHSERPMSDLSTASSIQYQDQSCQTDATEVQSLNNEEDQFRNEMTSEVLEETSAMKNLLIDLQALIQNESLAADSSNSTPETLHIENNNNNNIPHPIQSKMEDLEDLVKCLRQSLTEQQEQTQSWQDSAKHWRSVVEEMTQKMTSQISNEVYKRDNEIQSLLRINEDNSKLLKIYEDKIKTLEDKLDKKEEVMNSIQNQSQLGYPSNDSSQYTSTSEMRETLIRADECYSGNPFESSRDMSRNEINKSVSHPVLLEAKECIDSLRLSLPTNDVSQSIINKLDLLLSSSYPPRCRQTKEFSKSLNISNIESSIPRPEPKARTSLHKFKRSVTTDCLDSDLTTNLNTTAVVPSTSSYTSSSTSYSSNPLRNSSFTERRLPTDLSLDPAPRSFSHQIFPREQTFPGQPVQKLNPFYDNSIQDTPQNHGTTMLCLNDQNITPFMVVIPKKSNEIRLFDVKKYSQHIQPFYRFLFKCFDKNLGSLRREIFRDEDVVPIWEEKIIVWIIQR